MRFGLFEAGFWRLLWICELGMGVEEGRMG